MLTPSTLPEYNVDVVNITREETVMWCCTPRPRDTSQSQDSISHDPYRHRDSDQLLASDVDRNEISELLCRHYAEGRLVETEFNERVAQAVGARTRADLSSLLVDLPPLATPTPPSPNPRRRFPAFGALTVAGALWLAAAVALSLAGAGAHLIGAWPLLVFALFFLGRHYGGRPSWRRARISPSSASRSFWV
jgi:hypothetical protein